MSEARFSLAAAAAAIFSPQARRGEAGQARWQRAGPVLGRRLLLLLLTGSSALRLPRLALALALTLAREGRADAHS